MSFAKSFRINLGKYVFGVYFFDKKKFYEEVLSGLFSQMKISKKNKSTTKVSKVNAKKAVKKVKKS